MTVFIYSILFFFFRFFLYWSFFVRRKIKWRLLLLNRVNCEKRFRRLKLSIVYFSLFGGFDVRLDRQVEFVERLIKSGYHQLLLSRVCKRNFSWHRSTGGLNAVNDKYDGHWRDSLIFRFIATQLKYKVVLKTILFINLLFFCGEKSVISVFRFRKEPDNSFRLRQQETARTKATSDIFLPLVKTYLDLLKNEIELLHVK